MTKIIILNNKHCRFSTDDDDLFNDLRTFLSFKAIGVEFTPAYRNGWSGITYLMDKFGKFNSGLLSKAVSFLKRNTVELIVEDWREQPEKNNPIDISDKLKSMSLIPRDYQIDILNACIKNNKGIVRACTGAGKTLCIAMIAAHYNEPTIIGVIGLDLLQQFHKLFSLIFDEPIGFIGNGVCNIHKINICSIWTLASALRVDKKNIVSDDESDSEVEPDQTQSEKIIAMLGKSKLFIFDESHVVTTNTIQSIYDNIDPQYIFGFSGTPFRGDNSDLLVHSILGDKIVDVSATRLIDSGVLAKPVIKFVSVPHKKLKSTTYPGIYKEYIVENSERNDIIVRYAVNLIKQDYVPLVLFKQVKHGKILFDLFKKEGIKCEMLSGTDSLAKREEVKNKLNSGEISMIISSTIFDIGIDLPILNALILAGSGKSPIRACQRLGRVIRSYPGKTHAAVVDFYDNAKFLKNHSVARYNTYSREDGFKVTKSKDMK